MFTRRQLIASGTLLGAAAGSPTLLAAARLMAATPGQTEGPFYPVELPLDSDNDLVRVQGHDNEAAGAVTHLTGRVLDVNGRPVNGARVEIWQCDNHGVYHHPQDKGAKDADFQGFGKTITTGEGAYRFRTIKPVAYPGRTPHIHFRVVAPEGYRFSTQLYVKDHPQNQTDGLFLRASRKGGADSVQAEFIGAPELEDGALKATFDIVLGKTS